MSEKPPQPPTSAEILVNLKLFIRFLKDDVDTGFELFSAGTKAEFLRHKQGYLNALDDVLKYIADLEKSRD